nr:winged helix-turn-helix domain-containing protein [Arthrospira sp. PLM2.Bin9]
MPRKATLVNHYSSSELKQKYIKSQDAVESRRWHLLWKVCLGWTIKEAALAVGIIYEYGKDIVKKYNDLGEKGVENLKNKNREHRGAKPPLLSQEDLKKLSKELESRPSDGGVWNGPKVARWIEKEKGIKKVWNQRGWEYLKKLGYSWQTRRPKHNKGNPIKPQEFIKNLPNQVKSQKTSIPIPKYNCGFLMKTW